MLVQRRSTAFVRQNRRNGHVTQPVQCGAPCLRPSSQGQLCAQKRGGTGKKGGKLREDDSVGIVLTSMAHDHLLVIANDASCFSIRAFDVPERSRTSQVRAALAEWSCDLGFVAVQ